MERGAYSREPKRRILPLRADEASLLAYLARRKSSLEEVRRPFEPMWREIRQYLEPNLGKGLLDGTDRDKTVSEREGRKVLDDEPRDMLERYAAGMQSGITNYAQQWFDLVPDGDKDEFARRRDLKKALAAMTSRCSDAFKASNFYLVTEEVYAHSAQFGTSCCLMLGGGGPGELHLHVLDEGDYWIAEDRQQRVDTLMRRIDMTLAQAAEEFMASSLPESWQRRLADGELEGRVTVWNLVAPKDAGDPLFADVGEGQDFASFYWTEGGDGGARAVIDVRGFSRNPIIAYRHRHCGSVYGKGIGEKVLADLKELQKLEEYNLRLIAGEAMPPVQAPASLKGKVNNFPGGVTYYDEADGAGRGGVRRLYETHNAIEAVAAKAMAIKQRIARAFYNDLFSMMLTITQQSGKQMTAREVSEIAGEKVTLLGPVLTRMDHDFLGPAVENCLAIQAAGGTLGEIPAELADGSVGIAVEYTSSIHSEMKANLRKRALFNMYDVVAMSANLDPGVVAKVDTDRVVDEMGGLFPETAPYIRDTREAEKIRAAAEQRAAEQRSQAAMLEMAKRAGANARALSQTRVGNGNALEAIMAGGVA